MDSVEDLASAFARFPGIGPRQAKRFVYHLLATSPGDRERLSSLILSLAKNVKQCSECYRFGSFETSICNYCADRSRDDSLLMVVEKDQDLLAVERAGAYKGRYFVLGGVLTLSGKGSIRERELKSMTEKRLTRGLTEIVLALSATSEGEHTADRVRDILLPYRDRAKLTILGRGLATGSELEYADAATLDAALQNRKET